MALGPDKTKAATQFVEAMRPIAGDNVDMAQVRANLDALGLAVFRTLTVDAETASDKGQDVTFWKWISDVQTWINGVNQAIATWAAATAPEAALKAALSAVPAPQQAPLSMKGEIQ